ncbi:MAG: hypothetical protein HWQ43_04270 [Nostoc sp. JL31]|uniref:hypothetical protein n=1 Tax=Nostoc sp. JL31 TaxID=2815395 RepID=UPI0025D66DB2|nr:hypothetical protein [Nostoc sp. JL31]MBN3888408.1 hypothetical protein [Nostoc sp. JL31]
MNISELVTFLNGVSNILDSVQDSPELKRLVKSRYYSTSNNLVLADIQLVIEEVSKGLDQANKFELDQKLLEE